MLASAAMPGVYPPVEIEGRLYTDGGVSNNVPIAPAVDMGATTIYVMNSTSHTNQRRPLTRPMDYFFHAFTLARAQRLDDRPPPVLRQGEPRDGADAGASTSSCRSRRWSTPTG